MSMQDPIADMLTRIRNAQAAGHAQVEIPHSKMKLAIARVLQNEGFVAKIEEDVDDNNKKIIRIILKYYNKKPVISGIRRVSKSSCRVYAGAKEIPRVRGRFGLTILSTTEGILSGREARRKNVGGEVLCYVW